MHLDYYSRQPVWIGIYALFHPNRRYAISNCPDPLLNIARQGFGRGLCPVDNRFVAGGSSPSTISLYDLEANQKVGSVNLTMDVRNAIHGLELWPYDD